MSKRIKNVKAQLRQIRDVHGKPLDVLKIGKRTVGEIKNADHRWLARSNHGKVFHINNLNEGLKDLLSEYHLHFK